MMRCSVLIKKIIVLLSALVLLNQASFAQNLSINSNVLEWANLGTANVEMNYSVSKHFTLTVGGLYNNWSFNTENTRLLVQNKQQTVNAGIRYWPQMVYSGMWLAVKGQYKQKSTSGIWRPALEVGSALGGALHAGYCIKVYKRLHLDVGAGFWAGRFLRYTLYECPVCLDIRESGSKNFIDIDNITLSLAFVF